MHIIEKVIERNGFVFAFLVVGCIMYLSYLFSEKVTRRRVPGAAIAITAGLLLA